MVHDKALKEKVSEKSNHDKYFIRYDLRNVGPQGAPYGIKLEKVSKHRNLETKETCPMSIEEVQKLIDGDYSWMLKSGRDLVVDLYIAMIFDCIRPTSFVDYTRHSYSYNARNVHVTFDYDIRSSTKIEQFVDINCFSTPVQDNPIIMEVKWDTFLPEMVKDCVWKTGKSKMNRKILCM